MKKFKILSNNKAVISVAVVIIMTVINLIVLGALISNQNKYLTSSLKSQTYANELLEQSKLAVIDKAVIETFRTTFYEENPRFMDSDFVTYIKNDGKSVLQTYGVDKINKKFRTKFTINLQYYVKIYCPKEFNLNVKELSSIYGSSITDFHVYTFLDDTKRTEKLYYRLNSPKFTGEDIDLILSDNWEIVFDKYKDMVIVKSLY